MPYNNDKEAAKRHRDAYVARNPEKSKEQWRRSHLKRTYGITLEEYDSLLAAQDGVCAACGLAQPEKNLAVDHDHSCCPGRKSCGKCIRMLLCDPCNKVLGLMQDDPGRLLKLVNYLGQPRFDLKRP